MYLSELEEYISSLITYQSSKNGDEDAVITNIPFNDLPTKDWPKKDISIDAPYDTTVKTATGEEEESTFDIGLLKKRFEEKMQNNLIMPAGKGERQQNRDD